MSGCTLEAEKKVTELLQRWRAGSKEAGDQLFEGLYGRLRQMAAALLAGERRGHTLQPTELVSELVFRMSESETLIFRNRYEFFACAAKIMRHVLVDHARRKTAARRGGKVETISFTDLGRDLPAVSVDHDDLLAFELALTRLERIRPHTAEIFELRYFVGLSLEELAQVAGVSLATAKRRLQFASAWIGAELGAATEVERTP